MTSAQREAHMRREKQRAVCRASSLILNADSIPIVGRDHGRGPNIYGICDAF